MNRNFAIGCVVVLLLLGAVVAVVISQAPKLLKKGTALVMQTMADEARISALEKAWQPPSASPDAAWFPSTIGEGGLERSAPRTGIPELNISRAGQHATYRTGAGPIEVDVVPANDLEKETLLSRAEEALGNRRENDASVNTGGLQVSVHSGTSRVTTSSGNRKHVKIGGNEHTRFWWVKGTLFIFRARGAADSETFPEEYLRSISPATPPPAEPKLERP
jgi:hypothetical protein